MENLKIETAMISNFTIQNESIFDMLRIHSLKTEYNGINYASNFRDRLSDRRF